MRALNVSLLMVALATACAHSNKDDDSPDWDDDGWSWDDTGHVRNSPPSVGFLQPVDGQIFQEGETIQFGATVEDAEDPPALLTVGWTSSIDGDLANDVPSDVDGLVVFVTTALAVGGHVITLTATDTEGESASASIEVRIESQ